MDKEFYEEFLAQYSKYPSERELKNLCYSALIDSYKRVKEIRGVGNLSENNIRDKFIIDLEKNNKRIKHAIKYDIIVLIPESHDPIKKKRSDIRFKVTHLCEIIFECKKLKFADKKYFTDGLMRFINLDYAEKEDEAGMLGFILNAAIPAKLKEKVKDYYLVRLIDKPVRGYPDSFQSIHKRINSTEILISHLFFLM